MNKYEIGFSREESSVVLERRFSAQQVKRLKTDCTFKIDTKVFGKDSGIYVNIVKMRMRQVKITGVCVDSITIKYNDDSKKRFCGELEPGEIKSIEDHKGKVKITISLDRNLAFSDSDDYVEFQIVVTAFKGDTHFKCPRQPFAHLFISFSDCHDLDQEFMCKKNVRRSCISSTFVNDSTINCNEPYCSDEAKGCISTSLATSIVGEPAVINNLPQIFLSAITSLLITMLCCGGLLYVIVKIRRCINPPVPVSQTTTRVHRRRRRNNDLEVPESSSTEASPSAPPIDKDDLPPPYEVLFPERAKEEAQPNT